MEESFEQAARMGHAELQAMQNRDQALQDHHRLLMSHHHALMEHHAISARTIQGVAETFPRDARPRTSRTRVPSSLARPSLYGAGPPSPLAGALSHIGGNTFVDIIFMTAQAPSQQEMS